MILCGYTESIKTHFYYFDEGVLQLKHSSLYRQRYTAVGLLFFAIICLFTFVTRTVAQTSSSVTINEIRIDQSGTDNDEYFELFGTGGTSLDGLTYLVIGDGASAAGSGVIEVAVNLSGQSIPASGYFVAAENTFTLGTADLTTSLNFENSDNVTHLLVSNFTGTNGSDLDTNDDGVLDSTPWDTILDSVALVESLSDGELIYSETVVGPDGTFVPSHIYRCPDGTGDYEIGGFTAGTNDTPSESNCDDDVIDVEVAINEIRIDQSGTDNDEYFELFGAGGTSLNSLTYLVIGDGAQGSGVIEAVVSLSGKSIPASGYFVAAESTFTLGTADLTTFLNFENSDNVTHLLVSNFTGTDGSDLDTNDDGVLDSTPWDSILDSVGLVETIGSGDFLYSDTLVGPDGSFVPAHVYRCGNGTGNFEIGGFAAGTDDTPGASNCSPTIAINEIRIDQGGADDDEYVELYSDGSTSLDGLTYLVIGDGAAGSGVIETVVDLSGQSISASGIFVIAEGTFTLGTADLVASLNFENSDNVTHLLVSNFTGTDGSDLDTNDDGVLDSTPWDSVLDSVGLVETIGSGDFLYSDTLVGPDGSFVPAHVYRCPDGTGNFEIGGFNAGTNDTPNSVNDCSTELELVRVHQIQGDGASVAITNQVIVEAVVIGDYQEDDQLDGFFIQEEDADADTNPATSEGIFVYCGSNNCGSFAPINVGDVVRVIGTPTEFFDMSQIAADSIEVLSTGNALPTSASITLPITAPDIDAFYEQYEGMLVSFTNTLVVSEYFELARYGQIILYGDARPYQFTDENTPDVTGYAAHLDTLARNRVILDDDDNTQNSPLPDGVLYHPQPSGFGVGTQGVDYFRGGDTVSSLTGVLHWSFAGQSGTDAWRIRPVAELPITFTPVNTREASPAPVGGNVTVASLNVLNYFTSIDGGDCSANPADQCRGADSEAEFIRQTQQTVTAIAAMNADVVGLVEIENNGTAVATLVDELNAVMGAGTYAYIFTDIIGTDAITTAVIYKPAVVSPIGVTAVLDDPAFTDANNTGTQRSRPAVAQSFEVTDVNNADFGAVFTVVVNHLKSKGSSACTGLDCDQNDGAGAYNETRRLGAEYLVNTWIPSNPTGISDPDYIILGDLNAYASEAPISAIVNAGYTDLIDATTGGAGYSYVFDGQLGYLDYALTNSSMTPQVVGVTEWHVNADEVPVFDYNDTIQDSGEQSFEAEPSGNELFAGDGFRNSDHDPVIVGLDLVSNQAPIVDAGEDITVNEGSVANFSGSFTDVDSSDGHIISWDFGATTLIATQVYDDGPATIEVMLSVTDEFGATGTDTLTVTVENVAPTATLAALYPDPTFQGEFNTFIFSNQFDPSTADTDAGFRYALDCTDNGIADFITLDSASGDCHLVVAGDIVITGIIQDKDGDMTMPTVTVQVLSPVDGYAYIRQLINELQAEAGLNNGQTNALTSKVDNSESQYLRGNDNPAINQLNALVNQLQSLANSGQITEEQRASLTSAVQRLAVSIGSGY